MNINELLQQRAELDKKIENLRKEQRAEAIAEIRRLAADFSLSAVDCGFTKSPQKSSKGTVAAKYRSPTGETWTGRGKAPRWVIDYEKTGNSRTELLIK